MSRTMPLVTRRVGAVMAVRTPMRSRRGVRTPTRARTTPVEPRARLIEVQRARLLGAALNAVDELGYPQATVAHITSRARVSRRTFYDVFDNREDCLLAALESVVARLDAELAAQALDALSWRKRVRTGLWTIISFFDREPVLARVCIVQSLRGGPRVLERREQVLSGLARVVDEGRTASGSRTSPPLMADGLVGAAFGIVYGRLLGGRHEPLTDLFGELMGIIVLPYLGPAAARREQTLATPPSADAPGAGSRPTRAGDDGQDLLAELPMRLTYRTARVLEVLAAHPGISNRGVGERSGVADAGQISRLLARLGRLGLVKNTKERNTRGETNVWTLTDVGERVALSIGAPAERSESQAKE